MYDQQPADTSSQVLLLSQSADPRWVQRDLLFSAVREGWIVVIVNYNAAIFFGLILLTAGFGERESLILLAVQTVMTSAVAVILLILLNDTSALIERRPKTVMRLVIFNDAIIMLGWGVSALLFLSPAHYERTTTLLLLLTLTAVVSSALTAKLLTVMLAGRALIFTPAFFYLLIEQPPAWGLHLATVVLSFGIAIGVGYAIHIQHLRQACLRLALHRALDALRGQSETLAGSLREEQRSREQLARETALREQFMHSVTHDLRQPINALNLFLVDLRRRLISDRDTQVLEASQSCIASANGIIDSVSQLAWIKEHLPKATMTAVPLAQLFERVVAETRVLAKRKSLDLTYVPSSLAVHADAAFLERALRNLLHNAIQYTDSGRIILGARRRPGHRAEIQVIDSGRGVPIEEQPRIFEEFYQGCSGAVGTPGNIGLGLSIVANLAKAMDGEVTCHSVEGKGSMFGLILQRAEPSVCGQRIPLQGKSVLVLDDDDTYARLVADMLRPAGLIPLVVSTPQAIATFDADVVRNYDFVIADFQLGRGCTALDLLEPSGIALHSRCLIISAHTAPLDMQRIARNGWHFLRKPFTSDMVISAMQRLAA